jgi:hypothetical protein
MKLSNLAKRPQLVEITIDTPEIVEEYGEPITFHTWDRQPMSVFLKLATIGTDDYGRIVEVVRHLILDESGEPMLAEDDVGLPPKVLMAVVGAVVDGLGK